MSLFGRNDEKNPGDWGLRNGSLVDPILCLGVTSSSNGRSKMLSCLIFDLRSKTFEQIDLTPDKLWINADNTPVDSPKFLAIEAAKKIYRDSKVAPTNVPKVIIGLPTVPKDSSIAKKPKVVGTTTSIAVTSVPKKVIKPSAVVTLGTKGKGKNKVLSMGQSTSSSIDKNQEIVPNEEFSTQTLFDQVQAGKEAAAKVLQQSQSRLQANVSNSSNIEEPTVSSNDSTTSSTNVGKAKTKSSLLLMAGPKTTDSISNTFHNAFNQSQLEEESKNRRDREQALLLQDVRLVMNGRANSMNYGVNSSSTSTSNNSYHSTSMGEVGEGDMKDKEDSKTHLSGNSTTLSDSKSMQKINTNAARILNPNGKDSTSHCFLAADLVIDEGKKHKLNNEVSRFAGHTTRRPAMTGLCYVNMYDGEKITLVCIEEHIELLTKLVHAQSCQVGIIGRGGISVWDTVQKQILDKDSDYIFKDIISITLATTMMNSQKMKEWHGKLSNQVTSILLSMKTNFNADKNGK